MPDLDPTQWLLVGLALYLACYLAVLVYERHLQDQWAKRHYRTANGREIERDSRRVLHQPMAIRRSHTVSRYLPQHPFYKSRPSAAAAPEPTPRVVQLRARQNFAQIRNRGAAAAIYDMGHGGIRKPSPYTLGTQEYEAWREGYDAAFVPRPPQAEVVQTSARIES